MAEEREEENVIGAGVLGVVLIVAAEGEELGVVLDWRAAEEVSASWDMEKEAEAEAEEMLRDRGVSILTVGLI